jgi:predicted dehydrogenase
MPNKPTRRQFIRSSVAAATGGSILFHSKAPTYAKAIGANNRLRIAVAGLNGRGGSHIGGWLGQKNVEIVSLIDPDEKVLRRAVENVNKKQGGKCKGFKDVRKALEDPELDAISIATPNHWHSLMTIWAAQAGKHVYVEKPMSHDVAEGSIAVAAQQKYGVVVQHGTQQRSSSGVAGLHEAIKAGKWGKLKISYGYCCKPRGGIGFKKPGDPPENLDWDLWKGPAVIDQYHGNYVHYNWHWLWESGNGDLNNQGTHQLDVARWAIDDDQTHPVKAMAIGGRFEWKDQGQTPNSMFGMAEYPNGQQVFFNVRNVNYKGYQRQVENEYYFEDGGKIVRGHHYAKGSDKGEKVSVPGGKVTPGGNWGSFIAACREGKPEMANGNVHDAHYGCVLGHLMNNSYRLGEKVPFNQKAGKFGDNADAAEHFGRLHDVLGNGVGITEDGNEYTVGPTLTFDPKTETHTGAHAEAANKLLKDPNNAGYEVPSLDKV